VIAVIGTPRLRGTGPDGDVAGLAPAIAVAAAAAGSRVELIGKVGDDPPGDAVLLALARHFVGHVATLRDPARPTPVVAVDEELVDIDRTDPSSPAASEAPAAPEPPAAASATESPVLDAADVGLALRYLPELAVIVTVHTSADVVEEAVAASGWAQTALIVVVSPDAAAPEGLPEAVTVVAVADDDELEGGAGAAIGRFAAAIDHGEPGSEAYAELVATGSAT
jgi:sugar/nucleoside kinase (ribokinase family)